MAIAIWQPCLEGGNEDSEGDGQRGAGDAGEEVEEDVAHEVEEDGRRLRAPVLRDVMNKMGFYTTEYKSFFVEIGKKNLCTQITCSI